jgi:hypothetical protein
LFNEFAFGFRHGHVDDFSIVFVASRLRAMFVHNLDGIADRVSFISRPCAKLGHGVMSFSSISRLRATSMAVLWAS